jgi:hypothetical protein
MAAAMILFILTGGVPPILVLTLVVMCYLAGYELWKELVQSVHRRAQRFTESPAALEPSSAFE